MPVVEMSGKRSLRQALLYLRKNGRLLETRKNPIGFLFLYHYDGWVVSYKEGERI